MPDSDCYAPTHDTDALELTYEDAQRVLDYQVEQIKDIDDKAATTIRFDVLLLGIVLTAASITVRTNEVALSQFTNLLVGTGIVSLVSSLVAAIYTYTDTESIVGLDAGDIHRFLDRRYDVSNWRVILLTSSAHWIKQNEALNQANARGLFASHILLVSATALLTGGVMVGLELISLSAGTVGFVVLFVGVLLASRRRLPHVTR